MSDFSDSRAFFDSIQNNKIYTYTRTDKHSVPLLMPLNFNHFYFEFDFSIHTMNSAKIQSKRMTFFLLTKIEKAESRTQSHENT